MATSKTKKPVLDNDTIQQLLKKVYSNPKFKAQLIEEINRKGFRQALENQFRLSKHQVTELNTMKDRDQDEILSRIMVSVLDRNGKIELITEKHIPSNLSINFYARFTRGGFEVGVTVTC